MTRGDNPRKKRMSAKRKEQLKAFQLAGQRRYVHIDTTQSSTINNTPESFIVTPSIATLTPLTMDTPQSESTIATLTPLTMDTPNQNQPSPTSHH